MGNDMDDPLELGEESPEVRSPEEEPSPVETRRNPASPLRKVLRSPDFRVAAALAAWLVLLFSFAYFMILLNPGQADPANPMNGGSFIRSFFNFDGSWFTDIARYGYTGFSDARGWDIPYISTAFFPLYPAAIRLVSYPLFGHYYAAGLLVSWLSLLFALIYLRRLVLTFKEEDDDDAGFRACLFLLLFPTAIFLASGYSESLFLLCAVASFYHARRSSWILAGIWGFLACLARPVGLAVSAAVILEALRQAGWRPRNLRPKMAAVLLAPLGLVTYLAYLQWRFGDFLVFTRAEKAGWGWQREFNPKGLYDVIRRLYDSGDIFTGDFAKYLYLLIFVALFIVLTVFVFRRYGYPLGTFTALCVLAPLLTSPPDNPLMSMNRMVVVVFPAFMLLGAWGRKRDFERFYACAGTLGLALFTTLFVYGLWAG
jgi:hypothetical protein